MAPDPAKAMASATELVRGLGRRPAHGVSFCMKGGKCERAGRLGQPAGHECRPDAAVPPPSPVPIARSGSGGAANVASASTVLRAHAGPAVVMRTASRGECVRGDRHGQVAAGHGRGADPVGPAQRGRERPRDPLRPSPRCRPPAGTRRAWRTCLAADRAVRRGGLPGPRRREVPAVVIAARRQGADLRREQPVQVPGEHGCRLTRSGGGYARRMPDRAVRRRVLSQNFLVDRRAIDALVADPGSATATWWSTSARETA